MLLDAYYEKTYPEHSRTSCSDEHPINADADGTGCWRCNAVVFTQAARDAQDAERYRSLRSGQHWSVINGIGDVLRADALDAAIDNASKAKGAQ